MDKSKRGASYSFLPVSTKAYIPEARSLPSGGGAAFSGMTVSAVGEHIRESMICRKNGLRKQAKNRYNPRLVMSGQAGCILPPGFLWQIIETKIHTPGAERVASNSGSSTAGRRF
jgi:hypothetical protein